jgi:hypothetical protein
MIRVKAPAGRVYHIARISMYHHKRGNIVIDTLCRRYNDSYKGLGVKDEHLPLCKRCRRQLNWSLLYPGYRVKRRNPPSFAPDPPEK